MQLKTRVLLLVAVMLAVMIGGVAPAPGQDGTTLAITGVDFAAGTMEITNHGGADVDPNGIIVCSFPTYQPISGAATLGPGQAMTVDLGDLGVPAAAADGELGLYIDNSFDNPDSIISYVEWGGDGHMRSSVAQAAGIWDGTPLAADTAGLEASTTPPVGAADWSVLAAAQDTGGENAETLPATGAPTELIAIGAALLAIGGLLLIRDHRRVT